MAFKIEGEKSMKKIIVGSIFLAIGITVIGNSTISLGVVLMMVGYDILNIS